MIYLVRYICKKAIELTPLYYIELYGEVKESNWRKYLIAIDSVLNEVLEKI